MFNANTFCLLARCGYETYQLIFENFATVFAVQPKKVAKSDILRQLSQHVYLIEILI